VTLVSSRRNLRALLALDLDRANYAISLLCDDDAMSLSTFPSQLFYIIYRGPHPRTFVEVCMRSLFLFLLLSLPMLCWGISPPQQNTFLTVMEPEGLRYNSSGICQCWCKLGTAFLCKEPWVMISGVWTCTKGYTTWEHEIHNDVDTCAYASFSLTCDGFKFPDSFSSLNPPQQPVSSQPYCTPKRD
jgi:hypothetical protein